MNNDFKWVENKFQFSKKFIENCNGDSDKRCFLEVDVQYPEDLHELHNNLQFLQERMKIGKVARNLANFYDKKEYVIHMRDLKQVLNHGLVSKNAQSY